MGAVVDTVPPAVATEVFVCVTAPLSPGLSTRTVTFTFVGSVCVEDASAVPPAFAWLPAVAVAVFVWLTAPTSPGLPTSTATFVFCGPVWLVDADAFAVCPPAGGAGSPVAVLPAVEDASFVWVTEPVAPESSTRTAETAVRGIALRRRRVGFCVLRVRVLDARGIDHGRRVEGGRIGVGDRAGTGVVTGGLGTRRRVVRTTGGSVGGG